MKALWHSLLSVGTISIGSLVISVATCLRLLLAWVANKEKEINPASNALVRFGIWLLNIFVWIFEKICKQFTK